ncbi:TPA: hypothetical protein DIV55_05595 [Patescibacteria group bacterium]|uniref:mevalonate kinase n=1 Tax=Candidatus Gottesmanbacteria bacterium GW2011_GWA1_43_11 TaxID=1618436 RepID=A0A0G1FAP5_9BACT|nr:MAG: Mevalonate kinase [Candidatus Gottesmanbacteria bacterium GW2011_GWA1_43_11]HCS79182.1 hypothetical protein [Patescibacteria group bacterium]
MKITVSAPGKIHLSGLHAVVAGKPAVLVSTSLRLYVTLSDTAGKPFIPVTDFRKENKYFNAIVETFERIHKTKIKDIFIGISSDIPVSKGMGSSAALAVATIGALYGYTKLPWVVKEINEAAFQAEKAQHITPSGGDNTIVSFGGLLWYRKELEFLKTFWLLPFKLPKDFKPFVLINTGREESSGEIITFVVKQKESIKKPIFDQMEAAAKILTLAIKEENETDFRRAIKINEDCLEKLGVVSAPVKKMIREIEKSGGVAKITGAGGWKNGSGVVAATHDDPKVLIKIAKTHGFPSFQVQLGGEGVRREQMVI